MNKHADDSQRRHSLSDWLALHELDAMTCRGLLDVMACHAAGEPAADRRLCSEYQALNREADWLRTAEAVRDFLPGQQCIIDDTLKNTVRTVVERPNQSRKALTLDNGPTAYPTIIYTYYGEPPDSLIIAHEFGHALQIRASRGKFVPPIIREVCAFLAEGALLSHAQRHDEMQYTHLSLAWMADNYKYLEKQRVRLKADLLNPNAPYKYSWNYPIARYLSFQVFGQFPQEWIWSIFQGEQSIRQVLQKISYS